jgi:hypothetical protein
MAAQRGRDVPEAGLVERLVQLDAEDIQLRDAHARNTRTQPRVASFCLAAAFA